MNVNDCDFAINGQTGTYLKRKTNKWNKTKAKTVSIVSNFSYLIMKMGI